MIYLLSTYGLGSSEAPTQAILILRADINHWKKGSPRMTLLDRLNDIPPRPEEEAAAAEADYRLIQLPVNPAEFMVVFADGDTETLRCHRGAITGFERWDHYATPDLVHEIVRELRNYCS